MDLSPIRAEPDLHKQVKLLITMELVAKVLILCLVPLLLVMASYSFKGKAAPKALSGVFVAIVSIVALVTVGTGVMMIVLRNKVNSAGERDIEPAPLTTIVSVQPDYVYLPYYDNLVAGGRGGHFGGFGHGGHHSGHH
jgi:hypothetical protein